MMPDNCECCLLEIGDGADCKRSRYDDEKQEVVPGSQCPFVLLAQWEEKAKNWMASFEAAHRLDGCRELAGKLAATEESLATKDAEIKRLERYGIDTHREYESMMAERNSYYVETENLRETLAAKERECERLRDLCETLTISGCSQCGAEIGCNIDCVLCLQYHELVLARAALAEGGEG